ncbi:MAG: ACT domain-containing protein [Gammaproteobacteria bacterium]
MKYKDFKLEVLPEKYSVCLISKDYFSTKLLDQFEQLQEFLFGLIQTKIGYTWVGPTNLKPNTERYEDGWLALRIIGEIPFDVYGILSSILEPMAKQEISVFVLSDFKTDYILFKEEYLGKVRNIFKKEDICELS